MQFLSQDPNLLSLIAESADICLKPWKHSVVDLNQKKYLENNTFADDNDLILRIECRSLDGDRFSGNDIDLEIYASGSELSLLISWSNDSKSPILWHGKHSFWMDNETGKRCAVPEKGESLEALARRLRSIFIFD